MAESQKAVLEKNMTQRKVMALLREAANPACKKERRAKIGWLLQDAASGPIYAIEGKGAGIHAVLAQLYDDTIQHRPEILPTLFPAFAVMCGKRKRNVIVADIDWSLVK